MRVGIFTYGMRDHLTGIGRFTHELSYAMRNLDPGLQIVLLNPYPSSPLPWYRDFETYRLPSLALAPSVATIGSLQLARAAYTLKLDILHDPCGIAPFIAPRFGVKRVVTIYDAVPFIEPKTQPLMTHLVFRTLVPLARWTADAITAVSENTKRDLERHARLPSSKIAVVPGGVHLPSEAELQRWTGQVPGVLERLGIVQPYFLYVGALNPRKNVPRVVQAFRAILDHRPDARLIIVGPKTWLADAAVHSAQELGDTVRMTGFVDDETLHVLYAGATALVYPSLYEGFGLPPLEAMAHGTPVITSNTSSLPEVTGDAAILVDPLDVDAITTAMDSVLADTGLAEDISRRGRRRAALFGWDRVGQRMLDVYERVLVNPSLIGVP